MGKTPSKGRRSSLGGEDSPMVRFEGVQRGRSLGARSDDGIGSNRVIRQYMKELDKGIGDKVSLLKMLVIKCDEADQNFNRLRSAINFGEMDSVDR